jgi:hypothetical protein
MDFYAASIGAPIVLNHATNLQNEHAELKDQHERLKKQFADTVKALGESYNSKIGSKIGSKIESKIGSNIGSKIDLESRLQAQLHSQKLEMTQRQAVLQEQFNGLKVTAQTLSQSCKASEEKLFLQGQLHAEKLRLVEVTHNTLKDRCRAIGLSAEQHRLENLRLEDKHKSLSISAEQHRLANLRLEDKHKSLSNDLAQLVELEMRKDPKQIKLQSQQAEIQSLKSDCTVRLSQQTKLQASHQAEIQMLKSDYTVRLNSKEAEMTSLQSKFDSKADTYTAEARLLQGKINATQSLLKAYPIDPCLSLKAKNILLSSADILTLAHSNGGAESMRKCLSEVADALKDLNRQLDSHRLLASVWMDRVASLRSL